MHELSIASGLVEKLLEFAEKNPDKKIVEVRLAVGELSTIEEEQLNFCYSAITTETPLEGSTLQIEKIEAKVECSYCSYQGRPKYWDGVATLECPRCCKAAEAIEGRDCAIKSIRFTENEAILR